MLRISAGRMFRSARGARFDDRLQFHSGVAQNTVGHFELIAYSFSFWSSTSLAGTLQVPDRRAATPCLDVQFANFAPNR